MNIYININANANICSQFPVYDPGHACNFAFFAIFCNFIDSAILLRSV